MNTAQINALPRIEELPDDPAVLRGMLEQVMKQLIAANGKIENLQQQVEQMFRRLCGRSSEKWDPNQAIMDELLAHVLEQRVTLPEAPAEAAPVNIEC
jgi:hypothetical protein